MRCDDPKPPLYSDVPSDLADVAEVGCLSNSLTSLRSPCPRASWDAEDFRGRCAYIRTRNDQGLPYEAQSAMVNASGHDWILRDIDSGHSPQLSAPEELTRIILELVRQFEAL
jgi:hypothetical protein